VGGERVGAFVSDGPYTDAQYAKDRRRILKLKDKWLAALGLRWWHVDLEYSREPLPVPEEAKAAGWQKNAQCVAKWQYLRACITFNMPAVAGLSDDELETTFVHEACHALVNEMREWADHPRGNGIDHEERVVTSLANAFLWVREAGESAGRKAKQPAKRKGRKR
jgi:hypothetical protein